MTLTNFIKEKNEKKRLWILIEALTDVLDGISRTDLCNQTGLPKDRCREIVSLHNHLIENDTLYRIKI